MNQTPAEQWNALSALYEAADDLSATQLRSWLTTLRQQAHPLLPQLQRMLQARVQVETDDFLASLPRFAGTATDGADLATCDPRWVAGARVGPYRLVRPLGEGGMAEVWAADRDDGAFARRVAVKLPFMRGARDTLAARFDRERDILASLRHPHIAGLLDAGVTPQGQAWLALEYVEGEPLSTYCDRLRLTVRARVALFRQVLLAVQHAHANLVIHRDLKPGNILVTKTGEARLLDFGIAKLLEAEGGASVETELTRDAGRALTPRYASPEQLTGKPLTIACDVYALGVVLYELLSGERPYELKAESVAQLEQAILEVEPRAPSRRAGNAGLAADRGVAPRQLQRLLSPELDAIVMRCLRKRVADRYSSVDALLADIDRWLAGEAVLARAPSPWFRFRKFLTRHRLGMALGAAALVALIAMTTIATLFGLRAREESSRAVASRDFMLQLFRGADREKSRGADITARELLQAGREDVLTQLSGQPRLQTELLTGIAAIQFDMGEFASAGGTFEDVAKLAAKDGQSEAQALALAGQADTAVRLGDLRRATELLARARQQSSADSGDAAIRIAFVEGWIAAFSNQPDAARRSFERARALATRDHGPVSTDALGALRGAIFVARRQLHYDEALQLQRELEAIVRAQPHPNAREVAALAFRRYDLTYAAGRYAEGWQTLTTALAECVANLGANDEICRRMDIGLLKVRMRMGFTDADPAALRAGYAMAEDRQVGVDRASALYVLLRIESARGASPRQQSLVDRIEALVDPPSAAISGSNGSADGLNPADRIKLAVGLAEAALLDGDTDRASHQARRALALAAGKSAGAGSDSPWTATAKLVEAITERLGGRADTALPKLDAARRDICRQLGETHPMCSVFELDVAVALADLGRTGDALAIVRRARPLIGNAFGERSPLMLRLADLEDVLSVRLLRPALFPSAQFHSPILPQVFI